MATTTLAEALSSCLPFMRFGILTSGCLWAFTAYIYARHDGTPSAYADAALALLWVILVATIVR